MLDVIASDYMSSLKEIYALMMASQMLFYVDGNRRVTLSSEVDKHQIWLDVEMWKSCLQRIINLKFQDAVVTLEKQQKEKDENEKKEKESGIIGFFKKVADLPKKDSKSVAEPQKSGTMRISKTIAQNIVFNCQSTFSTFFVGLKLPFEQSRELTLHFCKKYELDQSRSHLLLSELEQQQKNAVYQVTDKDLALMS